MRTISKALLEKVEKGSDLFKQFNEQDWDYRYGPGKWSRKEILEHSVDSAANNHQRFVRIQFEETPNIVYSQDDWVSVQKYDSCAANSLIDLWVNYNNHLVHVIENIPKEKMSRFCNINKETPVTLGWLINDYVEKHMEHHLNQMFK